MYQDIYLSFSDEAAAKAVLYTEVAVEWEPVTEIGQEPVPTKWESQPNFANIDTIGVIYKPTGETTEQDGMTVPVMAPIPGWHVNVRLADGEDGSAIEPFKVQPATPMRVWG